MYDEDAVQAELMELYRKLEEGTLSEEELLERLEEIEEHKQRRGSREM